MITYGFSIQGKGHIEKGVVCQDSNKVDRIKSGHYIGIVADGVGSAAHSDIGSNIAVKSLFQYCNDHIEKNSSSEAIEGILFEGYSHALEQIEQYVKKQGAVIDDFDTTLSSVVYDGKNVVYGHAGDGGIIIRCLDGSTKPITLRQKGADGASVRPLRAGGSSWVFGTASEVASVLLVTDGMLDGVIQPVLVNLPPDRMALARGDFQKDNVYVTATEFFMNPYSVYLNRNVKDPDEYMDYFLTGDLTGEDQETFLKCILMAYIRLLGKDDAMKIVNRIKKYFYTVWAVKNVTDDKSVVCIMNEKAKITPQNIKFYEEPNWKWRQESYNALLYGQHMPEVPSSDPLFQGENKVRENKDTSMAFEKGKRFQNKVDLKLKNNIEHTDFNGKSDFESSRKRKIPKILLLSIGIGFFVIGAAVILIISRFDSEKEKTNMAIITSGTTIPTEMPAGEQEEIEETPIASETEIDLVEESEKFLEYLINVDVSSVSMDKKEAWKKAIDEYDFSDCIKILSQGNSQNNMDKSQYDDSIDTLEGLYEEDTEQDATESGKKDSDNCIDQIVKIMKEIYQKDKVDNFRKELESTYSKYKRKQRKKICNIIEKMSQENDDISESKDQNSFVLNTIGKFEINGRHKTNSISSSSEIYNNTNNN